MLISCPCSVIIHYARTALSVTQCIYKFVFYLSNLFGCRLQREEEAAYASVHGAQAQSQSHSQPVASQPHTGHASLGAFSKFEEKKTNEKTRKVTTVKKFFSPSSRTASKKGMKASLTLNWNSSQPVMLFDWFVAELTAGLLCTEVLSE